MKLILTPATISLLSMAALAATALTGCQSSHAENKEAAAPAEVISVRVAPAVAENSRTPIYASGQFTTDDEATLSFKTGGVVAEVLVKEGQAISAGQLLARLDLTEIAAGVQQAQLGLDKARRDVARAENLYKDSVVTLEQLQNARTALDLAQQQLATARFNLKYSEIRASQSGYVLRKFVNAGQVVAPGQSIIETNGAAHTSWKLKVHVSDADWGRLAVGDSALITTDAHTQPVYGQVLRKAERSEPGTGVFAIEVSVPGHVKGLASGLIAKATLYPHLAQQGYRIPYAALLDSHADSGFVFIAENGKAHRARVQVQQIGTQSALVTGLSAGQQIITAGGPYLTEGSQINIAK